jgi:hypothetical protein
VRAGATAARAGADVDAGVETRDAPETRVVHPTRDDMLRALGGVTRSAPAVDVKCVPKSIARVPENR